jgi:hypothetical protein
VNKNNCHRSYSQNNIVVAHDGAWRRIQDIERINSTLARKATSRRLSLDRITTLGQLRLSSDPKRLPGTRLQSQRSAAPGQKAGAKAP